jgi:hypothetical protein
MIRLYCRGRHGGLDAPCGECDELTNYARLRLARCAFQDHKPTCARCTVHCYRAEMRERIRAVMRYAGPRMLFHHPLLALSHLMDRAIRRPGRTKGSSGSY